ncbi:MAG: acyltransferase [Oscillospiraceae bacterium]|nr:acyltransferase [Oscillospiraceae bacterium]
MRKHYIDNLRTLTVLLLFPYHIFMVYNNWGERWYIHGKDLWFPSFFIDICSMWMMPLLFTVAGISSRYALERRSAGEYAKERVNKLLVPLIFGILLVVPIQSYIAGVYFNGGAGYLDFFTKFTDLSGYDGAFTPGHLWFILFLFVISMVCLPFMALYKQKGKGTLGDNTPFICVILLGLLPCIGSMLKIGGKSPTENLAYFLLGYFFLTGDKLLEKLEKYRWLLLGLSVAYALFMKYVLKGEFFEAACWLLILTMLGWGRRHLNFSGRIPAYLSKSSFGAYLFHQSWIVVTAFFIFKLTDKTALQIPLTFLSAISLTYLTYELCRRPPVTRWMFGLKK